MSAESAIREVLAKIESAWRHKQFAGLEACFHEQAVIVGPGYVEFARGRQKCADSYREFASNASVLAYSESSQQLRVWETTAVYTFNWEMTYRRDNGPNKEAGTDQLVLEHGASGWQVVWRFINFHPSE